MIFRRENLEEKAPRFLGSKVRKQSSVVSETRGSIRWKHSIHDLGRRFSIISNGVSPRTCPGSAISREKSRNARRVGTTRGSLLWRNLIRYPCQRSSTSCIPATRGGGATSSQVSEILGILLGRLHPALDFLGKSLRECRSSSSSLVSLPARNLELSFATHTARA